MKKDWVIHTKPHIKTPETVVKYLGRYTFRSAISLSRIRSVNNDTVRFDWLDYRDNQHKELTLNGVDFLQRFLSHVLPKGFMRIRHYGYLANCVRVKNLVKIRHSLCKKTHSLTEKTHENCKARYTESLRSEENERLAPCQKCKKGQLKLVGEILSEKQRRQESALMC
jgi:Putative transposase